MTQNLQSGYREMVPPNNYMPLLNELQRHLSGIFNWDVRFDILEYKDSDSGILNFLAFGEKWRHEVALSRFYGSPNMNASVLAIEIIRKVRSEMERRFSDLQNVGLEKALSTLSWATYNPVMFKEMTIDLHRDFFDFNRMEVDVDRWANWLKTFYASKLN